MTQLGFGTATFGPDYGLGATTPEIESAAALLREAVQEGIRYVDTAAGYGMAEAVVGLVAREIADHGVRVCTKIGAQAARSGGAPAALRESLERLGVNRVDTVMLHSVGSAALDDAGVATALAALRERELAVRTGASTYGVPDALAAVAQPWCGAVQVEHSILNPSVVAALVGHAHGCEIVARSVLCKGLLSSRREHAGAFAAGLAPALEGLDRLAAEFGWSLAELAIRYALDTPGVDVAVVGISTEAELRTALAAAARPPLDADALAKLALFNRSADDAAHPERWPVST
jgi:aryl-alcohol dehydrogenase-like predicted oxidoreductase